MPAIFHTLRLAMPKTASHISVVPQLELKQIRAKNKLEAKE